MTSRARLGVDLALLQHQDFRNGVVALAHQVGRLAHDFRAVIGGRRAPLFEALDRGFEGAVEIGRRGVRQMPERLFGRRIDDVLALAAVAVEPLAVDIEFEFAVHGVLSAVRILLAMGLACDNDLVPAVHAAMVGPCRSRNHHPPAVHEAPLRHDWTRAEVRALFDAAVPGADVPRADRPPRSISIRPRCRFRRCCRSRPAAARRIAPIARRARITTPASRPKS